MSRLSVFVLFLLFLCMPTLAFEAIPASLNAGGKTLVLNGSGVRTKFVVSLYQAGLYLEKKNTDANIIINANQTMALRLQIISGFIGSEKMIHASRQGFINATEGNTAPIQASINQFLGAFNEPIKKGDVFEFVYSPNGVTKISKNAKGLAAISGLPFKKALFGIWLSARPAQANLKNELLGLAGN